MLPRTPLFSALFGLTLVATAPVALRAGEPEPDPASERDFTVFLGLDLRFEHEQARYPVLWADRRGVQLLKDGERVRVSRAVAHLNSRIVPRVGRECLQIENAHGQRVHSYENDPTRAALSQHVALMGIQADMQEHAEIEARAAANRLRSLEAASASGVPVPEGEFEQAQLQLSEATRTLENAYANPAFSSPPGGEGFAAELDEGTGGTFDAFALKFEISTPTKVSDAHGVLRLFVRDPATSQVLAPHIKFFRLPDLGPEPRRITVTQTGLPPGFTVESYSVHVFVGDQELPTTLSQNQIAVSAGEAHQFLILQHMQNHRADSVPVSIIPELVPPRLRRLVRADQRTVSIDFTVGPDGCVKKLAPTPGIPTELGPELEAMLRRVRFLPALQRGRAVEGLGTFALGELLR